LPENSFPPHILSPGAALGGYLDIVYSLYMEDRLDVALQAAHDAFENTGWPAGGWTEFYNTLVCEADSRAASNAVRLDASLTIEVPREAGDIICDHVGSAARDARKRVGDLLQVEFKHPCLVAVLLPDAPLQFISASYGYAMRKNSLSKICVPWESAQSEERLLRTLIHEFTHVACSEITNGKRIPSWLGEGLALYVCGDASDGRCAELIRTDRKYARLLSINGIQRALNSRDLRKDDPKLVSAAYQFAGSLVSWWIDKKGIAKVCKAIALIGGGWDPALAAYVGTGTWMWGLVRQWRKHLSGLGTANGG
jgi:hypothetical protein